MTTIEAIKARLAAATPGPWQVWPKDDATRAEVWTAETFDFLADLAAGQRPYPNADLIANAPTDLAAMLAHVEAANSLDSVKLYQALQELANAADDARIAFTAADGQLTTDNLWPAEAEGLTRIIAALPAAMEALRVFGPDAVDSSPEVNQ